jgi:seryl-tRNA synthetase
VPEVTVELREPLPEALASEVERRLYFVSPAIAGFDVLIRDGWLQGVAVTCREPVAPGELSDKINEMIDGEVRPQRVHRGRVLWRAPSPRAADPDTFRALAERGLVSEAGEGQIAVGEPLLSLLHYFDRALLALLRSEYPATEFRYPTLISAEALRRTGYFASFPQHLMFVTRLRNDIEVYREFREADGRPDAGPDLLGYCADVDYCLPPTMCYHVFHQYRGRSLDPARPHVVTCRGKSFRFESAYATTLERLWDFTIREMVFMGTREQVAGARQKVLRRCLSYLEELGLDGLCEVANDPFFGGTDVADRISSQRLLELKYELRLQVAPGRTIAVGSFNFHDRHFGSSFGIDGHGGEPVHSACIGFGLERLVFAFLCQYGLEPAGWPEPVRRAVAEQGGDS